MAGFARIRLAAITGGRKNSTNNATHGTTVQFQPDSIELQVPIGKAEDTVSEKHTQGRQNGKKSQIMVTAGRCSERLDTRARRFSRFHASSGTASCSAPLPSVVDSTYVSTSSGSAVLPALTIGGDRLLELLPSGCSGI